MSVPFKGHPGKCLFVYYDKKVTSHISQGNQIRAISVVDDFVLDIFLDNYDQLWLKQSRKRFVNEISYENNQLKQSYKPTEFKKGEQFFFQIKKGSSRKETKVFFLMSLFSNGCEKRKCLNN